MMVAQNPYSSIVRAPATFRQVTRVFFLHVPYQDPGWSYPLVPVQTHMQGRRNFHGVVTHFHRRSRYSWINQFSQIVGWRLSEYAYVADSLHKTLPRVGYL